MSSPIKRGGLHKSAYLSAPLIRSEPPEKVPEQEAARFCNRSSASRENAKGERLLEFKGRAEELGQGGPADQR